jgi:hypothetical protein
MDTVTLILTVVIVILLVALVAALVSKRRSSTLKERFGPEYERTVAERGDQRSAESELRDRAKQRDRLDIRPLEPAQRERYQMSWRETQARFVDEPGPAVHEAHVLIAQVMRDRGYPVDDFETRSDELSVDHPDVVQNYRAAQHISTANDRGDASTEDLRQAMVHFRSLFDRLLDSRDQEVR